MLVSVCTTTFNHEKYISKAIEGALMQKTNFNYELVIGEDCSTDKTKEIISNYTKSFPDKIKAIFNSSNKGMIGNFINVLENCKGKYIAFCDGDDYWVDPHKLQSQIDFLEAYTDYALVHTDFNMLIEKKAKLINSAHKSFNTNLPTDNYYEALLVNNFICTSTVCARTELVKKAVEKHISMFYKWLLADKPIWLELAKFYKIAYINKPTTVRRIIDESAQNSKDPIKNLNFFKSNFDIIFYFIDKYGCSEEIKEIININYHKGLLWNYFNLKDKKLAKYHYFYLKKLGNKNLRCLLWYLGSKNILLWVIFKLYSKIRNSLL